MANKRVEESLFEVSLVENTRRRLTQLPEKIRDGEFYEYIDSQEKLDSIILDEEIALDIETSGLDPHTETIFLIAIKERGKKVKVVDPRNLEVSNFINQIASRKCIIHNASFEFPWFYVKYGVSLNVSYDTLVMAQMLRAGRIAESASLDNCLERELGIVLDKTCQKLFATLSKKSPLTNGQIEYSARDVEHLIDLKDKLVKKLKEEKMLHLWYNMERHLIPIIGINKALGIPVDMEYARELEISMREELMEIERKILDHIGDPKLNISSTAQMKYVLEKMGFELESTEKEELEKYKGDPLIDLLMEHRRVSKEIDYPIQWGRTLVNPVTHNVHPSFHQTQTSTGRFASSEPNAQNLPRSNAYRVMIKPQPGYKVVIADMSQIEVRIIANEANDQTMIDVFNRGYIANAKLKEFLKKNGLEKLPDSEEFMKAHPELTAILDEVYNTDFHRATASLLYKIPPKEVTKEQRATSKATTFGIPYGVGPGSMAKQNGIELQEAIEIMNKYFSTYSRLRRYLNRQKKMALGVGYTLSVAGRKRYYPPALRDATTAEGLKEWEKRVASIERAAMNHGAQSSNADIMKVATILADRELQKISDFPNECRIIMWVHDEIVAIGPEPKIKAVADIVESMMIKAGKEFLPRVPIEIGVEIADTWKK